MLRMRKGRIIPNGVILEKYEYKTILLFTEMRIDVELILKMSISKSRQTVAKHNRGFTKGKKTSSEMP